MIEIRGLVGGFSRRVQYLDLTTRPPTRKLSAVFTLVTGFVSIAVMATAAHLARAPMIFPSLGPTAFLFFYTPLASAASPRNTIIGHAIGAAAGWVSLAALGLLDDGPALVTGVSWAYVIAASAALALTASLMALLDAPHPPAGATTLIVALGLLTQINELLILMAAVVLLTVQAFVINRAAGVPYPRWSTPREGEGAPEGYRPV